MLKKLGFISLSVLLLAGCERDADVYHYRVMFKPSLIVPTIELK